MICYSKVGTILMSLINANRYGLLWYATFQINTTYKNTHKNQMMNSILFVAVHLGVKMADTLSFTAKVDMVDF